jgi:hypothetical protein
MHPPFGWLSCSRSGIVAEEGRSLRTENSIVEEEEMNRGIIGVVIGVLVIIILVIVILQLT